MNTRTNSALLFLTLMGTALLPSGAWAQSLYWGGWNGGTTSWTTASNWYADAGETTPGTVPIITDNLFFNTTGDNALGGTISIGANIAANSLTFNTSAATVLSQSGTRVLTLGGGGITVNSGAGAVNIGTSTNSLTVEIAANQTWTNNSSNTLTVRNFRVSNTATGPTTLTLNAASAGISFVFNLQNSLDNTKSLALVVDTAGTGTVNIPSSSYTGGTTVRRGILSVSGNVGAGSVLVGDTSGSADARLNLSSAATNNITVQAGSTGLAALTGSTGADFQGNIVLNRDVAFGSVSGTGQTVLYSGNISGIGNITVGRVATGTSSPTVVMSGANTYTGRTTLTSGTLSVSSLNSVVGGAASSNLGAPTTVADGTISMSSVVASTLRYTGTGEITDRVIDMAHATNGVTLEQAGTGNLNFTSNLSFSANGAKTLTLRGATAGTGEFSGIIGDSVGVGNVTNITKTDSGTWRLSGLNTYTGNTVISGGVLEVTTMTNGGTASSMGADTNAANNLTISGGGTLRYVGSSNASTDRLFTIGSGGAALESSGSGTITYSRTTAPSYGSGNTAYTLTLGGTNTGTNTYAANQNNNGTGAISISKQGSGTWVLTGTSTYTGTTTVGGGTLLVNGSLAAGSAVTVDAAGTLGGSGTINGATTVNGSLSPGNSPGVLSFTNALTLAGTANLEIDGTTRGSLYDGVNTGAGLLTLGGNLTLDFGAATSDLASYDLFNIGAGGVAGSFSSVTLAGTYSGSLTNNSGIWTGTDAGFGFTFNQSTGDLVISVVPEPSAFLMMLVGSGAFCLLRRRRSR